MIMQRRNPEMVDLLRSDFQHRNEPNFAWKSAVSALLGLPALVGAWPGTSLAVGTGNARDMSGSGAHLTNNNSADWGYDDLAPYLDLDGTNQYFSRADAGAGGWGDVLGNEAYIIATQRGVTFGGWFWVDTVDATAQFLIGKGDNTLANTNYLLQLPAGSTAPQFAVSNGVVFNSMNAGVAIGTGAWGCVIARYVAATQTCTLWTNGIAATDAVGVPAAPLVDNALAFTIGAGPAPSLYLDGRWSMCFLCMCAFANGHAFSFFQQTRAMFGV